MTLFLGSLESVEFIESGV